MIIHNKPIQWYIDKLKNKEYFSLGMYGDGEWIAIFKKDIGGANAEDTIYTKKLCDELAASLQFKPTNFLFSVPEILKNGRESGIGEVKIRRALNGIEIEFYEKDMWDREVREGGFVPFIEQLQKMNVVIIGNKHLRKLDFLGYDKFVEISYPNCFGEMDRVVKECLEYGKPAVYLFSAGLPATLFIQALHGRIPKSFFLDMGSVWDAFVGIGAQRGWRAELYADKDKYNKWLKQYATIQ